MSRLAPGVPADYYDSIYAVEMAHWWHRGMRRLSATLLGERLTAPALRFFDAGCGTGGFLSFVARVGTPSRLCGVDISSAAVELARTRVPGAELHLAPVWDTPFEPAAFDVIVMNDVLQHLPREQVAGTLAELRRLLVPGGTVLMRTGGALTLREERDDWRAYDRRTLVRTLRAGGFEGVRATYVNLLPSLWALAHGSRPHAPTEERHGIAQSLPGRAQSAVALRWLELEAAYLKRSGRGLPYGHTLLALASAPA